MWPLTWSECSLWLCILVPFVSSFQRASSSPAGTLQPKRSARRPSTCAWYFTLATRRSRTSSWWNEHIKSVPTRLQDTRTYLFTSAWQFVLGGFGTNCRHFRLHGPCCFSFEYRWLMLHRSTTHGHTTFTGIQYHDQLLDHWSLLPTKPSSYPQAILKEDSSMSSSRSYHSIQWQWSQLRKRPSVLVGQIHRRCDSNHYPNNYQFGSPLQESWPRTELAVFNDLYHRR